MIISLNLQSQQIVYMRFINNQSKIEIYRNPPILQKILLIKKNEIVPEM